MTLVSDMALILERNASQNSKNYAIHRRLTALQNPDENESTGLRYAAVLSQTGTDAPTIDDTLLNELGAALVWAYVSAGVYTGTLAGAFEDKVIANGSGVIDGVAEALWKITKTDDNVVTLTTTDGGVKTDALLTLETISFDILDETVVA